jgi:hypothetical protein
MKVPAASCVSRSAAFWRGMVVAFLVSVPLTELAAQQVVRGPYLQRGAPSSMVVRWRTDKPISLALATKMDFPSRKTTRMRCFASLPQQDGETGHPLLK